MLWEKSHAASVIINVLHFVIIILILYSLAVADDPDQYLGFTGSMYNERGFLKANSISEDGDELVNDYNGNLMYVKALANVPIASSGMNCEMKLIYNGSVAHFVPYHFSGFVNVSTPVNSPEWILSVNGIAVQVFNFEDFLYPTSLTSPAENEDVPMFLNGYHNSSYYVANTHHNPVRILMGDGSTIEYSNEEEDSFVGYYYPYDNNSHEKGYMSGSQRHRIFTLYSENGVRITFEEKTFDLISGTDSLGGYEGDSTLNRFFYFLPIDIRDQYNNYISFSYNEDAKGRPRLSRVGDSNGRSILTISWPDVEYPLDAIDFDIFNKGIHKIYLESPYGTININPEINTNSVRRTYIKKIIDPESRVLDFTYDLYRRVVNSDKGDRSSEYGYANIRDDYSIELWRLSNIRNYYGGYSSYLYYGQSLSDEEAVYDSDTILIDGRNCQGITPCYVSDTAIFSELGRDPFNENIVISKRKFKETGYPDSLVAFDSVIYSWNDDDDDGHIDLDDIFETTKLVSSIDSIPDSLITHQILKYRQYPTRNLSFKELDYGWHMKLLNRSIWPYFYHQGDSIAAYKEESYDYDTGLCGGDNCDGTLWMTKKTTQKVDAEFKEEYDYDTSYCSVAMGESRLDVAVNIKQKTITSPTGVITTYYYDTSFFNIDTSGLSNLKKNPTYSRMLYSNTLIDSTVVRFSEELLSKSYNIIITDTSDTSGMVGQIKETRSYVVIDGNIVDSTITKYFYHRPPSYAVGNLYKTYSYRSPNNIDSAIYYYACNQQAVYEYRNDGTIDTTLHDFCGACWDWSKRVQFPNDSIELTTYKSTGNHGQPLEFADENNNYSIAQYDSLLRVARYTLPYDFRGDPTLRYDTSSIVLTPYFDASHLRGRQVLQDDTFDLDFGNFYCNDSVLHYYHYDQAKDTPSPIFDSILSPILAFFNPEIAVDSVIIDSIYLNLYECYSELSKSSNVEIYRPKKYISYLSCATSQLMFNQNYLNTSMDTGWNRIDVTPLFNNIFCDTTTLLFTLDAFDAASGDRFFIYSTDYQDSTKWPYLEIYYNTIEVSELDNYTVNYEYNDNLDSNGISIISFQRTDSLNDPIALETKLNERGLVEKTHTYNDYPISRDSVITIYDFLDNKTQSIDQLGQSTYFKYDIANRLIKTIYPDSNCDSTSYCFGYVSTFDFDLIYPFEMPDSFLQKITFYNENGDSTEIFQDVLDQKRAEFRFLASDDTVDTYFDYDMLGNLICVIKPEGDSVVYSYNSLGQLLTDRSSDYAAKYYQYDWAGNIIAMRDGSCYYDSSATDFKMDYYYYDYDGIGRLVESGYMYLDGKASINGPDTLWSIDTFRIPVDLNYYDFGDRTNSKGQISLEYSNDSGYMYAQEYDYDARGRVIKQSDYYRYRRQWSDDSCIYLMEYDTSLIDFGLAVDTNAIRIPQSVIYELKYGNADTLSNSFIALHIIDDNVIEYSDSILPNQTIVGYSVSDSIYTDDLGTAIIDTVIIEYDQMIYYALNIIYPSECYYSYSTINISRSGNFVYSDTVYSEDDKIHDVEDSVYVLTGDSVFIKVYKDDYCNTASEFIARLNYMNAQLSGFCSHIDTIGISYGDTLVVEIYKDSADFDSAIYSVEYDYIYADICDTIEVIYPYGCDYAYNYSYNSADQLKSIKYPGNSLDVYYEYDNLGRISSIGDSLDSDKYASFSYTKRGEKEQMILGNPSSPIQVVNCTYNPRGWPVYINDHVSDTLARADIFHQHLYYYEDSSGGAGYKNGNIKASLIEFDNDSSFYHTYNYDNIDRLRIAGHNYSPASAYPLETFAYDKNGNITRRTFDTWVGNGDTTNYSYILNTNQCDGLAGHEDNTFTYDSRGNLETDSARNATYNYSYRNCLDEAVIPNQYGDEKLAFGYSQDGLRVYKRLIENYRDTCDNGGVSESSEKNFLSDGEGIEPPPVVRWCTFWDTTETRYIRSGSNTLMQRKIGTSDTTWYIYAGEDRIARVDTGRQVSYYLKDHLGTTRAIIRDDGTVTDRYYRYYAYGETESEQVTSNQEYKYTGKPLDTEFNLDLYYFGARYYMPSLGRWMAVDPMHNKYPGWSPYVYCADNPVKYIDPDGEAIDWIVDAAVVVWDVVDLVNEPSWTNAGNLGIDIVTGVAPFLPAVGAVRHGAKIRKLFKGADKIDDAIDAGKGIDKVADASKSSKKINANSLDSPKETSIYDLKEIESGAHLKYGVTSQSPPERRYTKRFMSDKRMEVIDKGSRKEMAKLEREVVENNPGPLNKEKWAGKNKE